MKFNSQNEQIKRKYEQYLTHSKGLGTDSINVARRALARYDAFSKHADYKTFNAQKAIDFKAYLEAQKISKTTHANCIKQMKQFFEWLALQPGYKSKIQRDAVDYLNLSHKEKQLLRTGKIEHTPTLENVRQLVQSIKPTTEVDQRDRALISFLCLTGMRDSAVATLSLKAFDANTLLVDQNPEDGVKTKFTKHIYSKMFRFDEQMVQHVLDWVAYLYKRGFVGTDPMFPRSRNRKEAGNLSFQDAQEVEPVFWKDGTNVQRIVKQRSEAARLEYFHPHLYRHLAIQLALTRTRGGDEIKAVSQNFGHEEVATTLSVYGNYQPAELITILQNIDGRPETEPKAEVVAADLVTLTVQQTIDQMMARVLKQLGGNNANK